jgi:RNA polymerase sigma factor (sigma-70 family)
VSDRPAPPDVEDLLRDLTPQVLGALVRRHGQFDACEDAVQEALLDASVQWSRDGVPDNPRGWLQTAARRALIDAWRSDNARQRREVDVAAREPRGDPTDAVEERGASADDTLSLLFWCCHPALSPASQLALTLRAVGGLTTAQIAAAFHVPEATMAQRVSRAKQQIRAAGGRFQPPRAEDRGSRLAVVRQVLYLVFNEGYTSSGGSSLGHADLVAEAVRLARMLHRLLPADGEVSALLALMRLVDARRAARTLADGSLVPLQLQDRSLWDRAAIAEGRELLLRTLGAGPVGPYQVQAAIAALHDEAVLPEDTDWPQILALYGVLEQIAPSPMVRLSRAVAVSHVHGPTAALVVVGTLDDDARAAHSHRVDAVRGHLLEQAGDHVAARASYLRAARVTASVPEQRYLLLKAAGLHAVDGLAPGHT